MKRFLTIIAVAATASGVLAQSPTPRDFAVPETISVSGTGKAKLTPDRFTFSVGVQTVGNTVEEAVNENNRRVAAVVAALKGAGAEAANIQTSNFNIFPQQDYQEGRLPRILGYQVSNNVTVRSAKLGDAGRLLGVAINAGVNTSSGLNFEVSEPARGRDQGMRAAFEEARAKATILAKAAGRTVGRAITISEGIQSQPPIYQPMQRAMAMEAKAVSDVPVEPGTEEVTYTVSVVFELR